MSLRSIAPPRQRMEALCTALVACRLTHAYIDKALGKPLDADDVADGLKKLIEQPENRRYRNYCEAVIFEEVAEERDRQAVIALMQQENLTRAECDEVIGYWHAVQLRAHFYTERTLPLPKGLGDLLRQEKGKQGDL